MPFHPIAMLLGVVDVSIGIHTDKQLQFGRRIELLNKHTYRDYLRYKVVSRSSLMLIGPDWPSVLDDCDACHEPAGGG
jgi:hypothetical protein